MLIKNDKLLCSPVISIQASAPVATLSEPIIDPNSLKIVAFRISGPAASPSASLLAVSSIREYSSYGAIIDTEDEFVADDDIVKIKNILELNFHLINLRVETKKGTNLGKISGFTVTPEDFILQQLLVKRPLVKSFIDPELTSPRQEVVEVTDTKIIVRDEEKVIRERATKEDFIPNFVNPFREPGFAPIQTKTPDDKDN